MKIILSVSLKIQGIAKSIPGCKKIPILSGKSEKFKYSHYLFAGRLTIIPRVHIGYEMVVTNKAHWI